MNKTKNEDNWKAFGPWWFDRHKKKILWCLNAPVIGMLARWILRIHRDCPTAEIIDIKPNCYTIKGEKPGEYKTDFRTHWKFSKRIYFALKPVWWAMHYFDEWFLNKYFKNLSFGYDILTSYSDTSSGLTTVDGSLTVSGKNDILTTLLDYSNGVPNKTESAAYVYIGSSTTTNRFGACVRGISTFDTSSIEETSTIDSAYIQINVQSTSTYLGGTNGIYLVASNPASNNNLINSDYSCLDNTLLSTNRISATGDQTFTLNQDGLNNIDKSGISKFGYKHNWDYTRVFDGTWGSNKGSGVTIRMADYTGTSYDPKLVVTYTAGEPPAGGGLQQVIII